MRSPRFSAESASAREPTGPVIDFAVASLLSLALWQGGEIISVHCGERSCGDQKALAAKLCPAGYDITRRHPYAFSVQCRCVWVLDVKSEWQPPRWKQPDRCGRRSIIG